ncbi:uncharacterized protein [Henckelia pumila]|uniref:uncharacterized protein n=1 Tax=Henckelia pumila TaxID=405737 RepID=UPI003C6E8938
MERFFDIVHVPDTTVLTLKRKIRNVLGRHKLHIKDIRGQGYNGASNMRGSWNGLQAFFLSIGTGLNQIGTLQRAGKTRWSSHFESICSMIDMYKSMIIVLEHMVEEASSNSVRGKLQIMGVTDLLCRALQEKCLDILNAMNLVSTTKALFHTLRAEGYDILLMIVQSVCENNGIEMPDMSACYRCGTGHSCQKRDSITFEYHYRFDVFNAAIDFQVEELNSRFNDGAIELLRLSVGLEPRDNFKLFNVDDIFNLAEKFYPGYFNEQELHYLRSQLEHYKFDIIHHERFQNIYTISELCRRLVETEKAKHYHLIDRLIRLVLTLPFFTSKTEQLFSAMKLLKTSLQNKMEEDFLADSMIIYIEREFTVKIDTDSIIDEFYSMKTAGHIFNNFILFDNIISYFFS